MGRDSVLWAGEEGARGKEQGLESQSPATSRRPMCVPTCTVMAAFLVIVWYMPMKATLLSRS